MFRNPAETHLLQPSVRDAGSNLFMTGFVSSSMQLLMLREMMNITGGYELIAGTFLASWLILSAAGSAMAGKQILHDPFRLNLAFSAGPLVSLILLMLLSGFFTIAGQTPSFLISFIYTFIVLLPFCFISGFTFVRLIRITHFTAGKSFSIETAGGILAGLTIPVITAGIMNTYQLMISILVMSFTWTILTYTTKRYLSIIVKMLSAAIISLMIIFNIDILFRQLLLPGINVIDTRDTPYGNLTTGEYSGERSFYYNHRLISYISDVAEREENIHYALLQCDKPEKIILISGSLSSHVQEIIKYPVKLITYIERDPLLVKTEKPLSETGVDIRIAEKDAFTEIRKINDRADAIIVLVPPPSTLLLNRYYTREFFAEAKKKLSDEGIFMCSPGAAGNYYNEESVKMLSSVFNSLKSTFKNVLPVQGNKLFFIASDKPLSGSYIRLTELRGIQNTYVGPDYLSDDLIKSKIQEVLSLIDPAVRQNTADFPVAYFNHQSLIFSMDPDEKAPSLIILFILFAVPVMTVKRKNMVMYSAASAIAGFEIIQLITLQLNAGNMYQLTGILIASLMAGLATGAVNKSKAILKLSIRTRGVILAAFYIFASIINGLIGKTGNEFLTITFLVLLTFLPAFLTGTIFSELTSGKDGKKEAPSIYSSDLAGSALGFIITASVLIPLAGIMMSGFALSMFIFTGFLIGTIRSFK